METFTNSNIEDPMNLREQEIIINYNYSKTFNLGEDAKLSDLRLLINKEFMTREDEYEIFIKDTQLLIINQELKISSLIQNYQSNEFTVKSYKSKLKYKKPIDLFDFKKELIEYNDYLDYTINKKEEEFKSVAQGFEDLFKSLESI